MLYFVIQIQAKQNGGRKSALGNPFHEAMCLLKLIVFSVHQILKLISLRRRKRQERQQIPAQNRICRYLRGRSRQKRKILVTVLHTFMVVYVELKKETALFINFS